MFPRCISLSLCESICLCMCTYVSINILIAFNVNILVPFFVYYVPVPDKKATQRRRVSFWLSLKVYSIMALGHIASVERY